MSEFPKQLLDAVVSSERVLIATHVSPDPDALGSSGALALGLASIGKHVSIYLPEEFPERLSTLFPVGAVTYDIPEKGYLLIGLDCATKKRLGEKADRVCSGAGTTINIDHHGSNEQWATLNFIVPDEPATASLVYQLLRVLSISITSQIASSLYAGIMDDTGSFRFSNTTDKVLKVASELVGAGASPADIAGAVYFQEPLRSIQLKGKAISTIRTLVNGRAALAHISLAMRGAEPPLPGDSEGIIDVVRAVKGVEVAVFLKEKDPSHWRGSIRSKSSEFDVSAFAEKFGGGGHKAAAGFSIDGTEQVVLQQVEQALSIFLSR
jgi:bifunctional oligoribonuclease and PAP phosphatase NrnA